MNGTKAESMAVKWLTIRMKHFRHKAHCRWFVGILLCELHCQFESTIFKGCIFWPRMKVGKSSDDGTF